MGARESKEQKEAKQKKQDQEQYEAEKLVAIATRFLESIEENNIATETKKAFLKKKGLSDEQIKAAFQRYEQQKKKKAESPVSNAIESKEQKPENKPEQK